MVWQLRIVTAKRRVRAIPRANEKAKSIRARYTVAPSPAFGTLSHKWERGKT